MKKVQFPKELLDQLKTQSDVEDVVGGIYKQLVEHMLNAEMDEHLGYEKNDRESKDTTNSRNGKSSKRIKTSKGEIEIEIPRDRDSDFDPVVVPKHQRVSQKIEDAVISMYAKGLSNSDIEEQVDDIYGVRLSPASVTNITNKVLDHLREWQSRALDSVYFVLWIDGIIFKVRQNGRVINKTVYVVIGLSHTGYKEVLGLWISENESASFWMGVFSDLQSRGVEDVLILCSDNLKGITDAVSAIFQHSLHQICVVHQIRNSILHVSWNDRKAFLADLKEVYKAPTADAAAQAMDRLEENWGKKYPYSIRSWRNNWGNLTIFFDFPEPIRRIIYTTNVIESFNSMVRRNNAKKVIFPSDEAVFKSLYLTLNRIHKKWNKTIRDWGVVMNQFLIIFGDRCRLKI